MAIKVYDFVNNVVVTDKNAACKIEGNYCYVYPYGDRFNNTFYSFDFVDEKSISEKGVYFYNDNAFNVTIDKVNERFYLSIKEKIDCNKIDITKKCNKITDEEIKKRLIKCIKKINKIFNTLKKDLNGNNIHLINKDFLREYSDLLNKIADDLENFHKKW